MNETETRTELIDPALKATGWGVVEGRRSNFESNTHRQKPCNKLNENMTGNKEHQPQIIGIKHWDFSGYASLLPRIKFGVTVQASNPQSPTFHTSFR